MNYIKVNRLKLAIALALLLLIVVAAILLSKHGVNFAVIIESNYNKDAALKLQSSDPDNNVEGGNKNDRSLGSKIKREKYLIAYAVESKKVLDEHNLYQILMEKGIEVEKDIADRMRNGLMTEKDFEWLQVLIASNLNDEENYKVEVSGFESFEKIKSAYLEREKKTGFFYGNDILSTPVIYKDASSQDIIEVLKTGAVLPEDVILSIIVNNRIDLAVELNNAGYAIDVNYYDELTTTGLMEAQVQIFAWNPQKISMELQIDSIEKLKDIGVPIKEGDGTRDAMDRALEYAVATNEPEDAKRLILLAKKLNEMGLPVEASHHELLSKLQLKYPDIHTQYIDDFH